VVRGQDGFLTTHTIENVRLPEDELLKRFVGDPRVTVRDLFDTKDGLMSGVVQNQDSYMKGRIAQRAWYDRLVEITERAWPNGCPHGAPVRPDPDVQDRRRRLCHGFDGTMADTALAVVDHLRAAGRKVGCITSPASALPAKQLAKALANAKVVAVVERTDEPAAADNPLTRELKSALADAAMDGPACRVLCRPRPASARATSSPATSRPSSTGLPTRRPSRSASTLCSASATRSRSEE